MTNTMTKKEKYNELMNTISADATFSDGTKIHDFFKAEIERLGKRSNSTADKRKSANSALLNDILAFLSDSPVTIREIQKAVTAPDGEEYSTQKLSAVMRDCEKISKTKVKGIINYTLAE